MLPEKTLPGWQGLCGPQLSVPEPQRGNRVNQSPGPKVPAGSGGRQAGLGLS